jgi:N-methylhydantoinase B
MRTDGSQELLQSKCDRIEVREGDLLYFDTWGGGGWGDPLERPADQVAADVDAGLVTVDGARRYGVVVNADRSVDEKKTKALRARMAKKRGATQLFDKGGTIEELKKRCKRETGLNPPRQPEFKTWVKADNRAQAKKKKGGRKSKAA